MPHAQLSPHQGFLTLSAPVKWTNVNGKAAQWFHFRSQDIFVLLGTNVSLGSFPNPGPTVPVGVPGSSHFLSPQFCLLVLVVWKFLGHG